MAKRETSRAFTADREDGSKINLVVREPSRAEVEHADDKRAVKFNSLLRAGVPTRRRMLKDLKANGLWSEEDQTNLVSLQTKANEAEVAHDKALKDGKDTKDLKTAYDAARRELILEFQDIESMLSQTVEAKSEAVHRNILMACVIENADGGRLWSSVTEMLEEQDIVLIERVAYEYQMFAEGLPSDWKAPEATDEPEAEPEAAEVTEPVEPEPAAV